MSEYGKVYDFVKCHRLNYYAKIHQGSEGIYITCIRDGQFPICSCPSRKPMCKHVRSFIGDLDKMSYNIKINRESIKHPSSIDGLNEIFESEFYNDSQQIALYGDWNIGKTTFLLQETCFFASNNKNVLFVDTEGSAIATFNKWNEVFENRFGDGKGKIIFQKHLTLESFFEFLGLDVKIMAKEKKMEIAKFERLDKSPIDDIVKKNKIDLIVVDSITKLLKFIPSTQQNFPTRSGIGNLIFARLTEMMEQYGCCVITTHHLSQNPANPFSTVEDTILSGGNTVGYNSKRIILIDKRQHQGKVKKDVANYRRLWAYRMENHPDFSKAACVHITDDMGMVNVEIGSSEYKRCFNSGERKRLGME